ncbi:LpxL/LpxP family acyltransferase [Bacillus sp. FJAT-27916]|uniref:LpxL/LpxP family acyltransferase n=1 Tax=Bacillus sp. FJAT-27916 TaxID=1679169 RepID=UPI0006707753|nr:hypothetical protein [Bacillus sp. FJAT-27916]
MIEGKIAPPTENAFLFESLVEDYGYYKSMAKIHKDTKGLVEEFLKVREISVNNMSLEKRTTNYKKILKNVLSTNIGCSSRDRHNVANNYFIRDYYENPVYYGIHLLNFGKEEFVKENVVFEGKEKLENALKKNGNVILNGFHMDLYQILLNYIAKEFGNHTFALYAGEQPLTLVKKIQDIYMPEINNIEYRYVDDMDDKPFPLITKELFKDARKGNVVCILPEVSLGLGPSDYMELLGVKVLLPHGSSTISHKYNIPIVPVYNVRTEGVKIKIIFEDPIYPSGVYNKENIQNQTREVFEVIEKAVSKYPHTWSGYDVFDYLTQGVYRSDYS